MRRAQKNLRLTLTQNGSLNTKLDRYFYLHKTSSSRGCVWRVKTAGYSVLRPWRSRACTNRVRRELLGQAKPH